MNLFRDLRLGLKNLMLHKLRSLLAILGVVFGVASVIAMLAIGEGAKGEVLERIHRLGSRLIFMDTTKPADGERGDTTRARMSVYGLKYSDAQRMSASFAALTRVVPVKFMRKTGRVLERVLEVRAVGTTPGWFELVKRPLLAGRALSTLDEEQAANVAVLTEQGARRLLTGGEGVGSALRIGTEVFTVTGIVQSAGGSKGDLKTPDQDTDAYIPLSSARRRFGDIMSRGSGRTQDSELVELHQIIAEVDAENNVEAVAAGLGHLLKTAHRDSDYEVRVPLALLRQAEETQRTFNIVLGSIAGVSLLVGGIGIMNIMLASVTERTREIGIRRAIGATRTQIVRQFLAETVALSGLGGILGVGLGMLIPGLVTQFSKMPTQITPGSVALAFGISAGVGIVFGLYPAARAAALDPIAALRHD